MNMELRSIDTFVYVKIVILRDGPALVRDALERELSTEKFAKLDIFV